MKQLLQQIETDYTSCKVIQFLACNLGEFNKSTLMTIAKHFGHKVRNTEPILELTLKMNIFSECTSLSSVPLYCVSPDCVVEILRTKAKNKTLDKLQKEGKGVFGVANYYYNQFMTLAILCAKGDDDYKKSLSMLEGFPEMPYINRIIDVFLTDDILCKLAYSIPLKMAYNYVRYAKIKMLYHLDPQGVLERTEKLVKYKQNEEGKISEDIIVTYEEMITHQKMVVEGDIVEALKKIRRGSPCTHIIQGIVDLHIQRYEEAAKSFSSALTKLGVKFFNSSLFNFYYTISLKFSKKKTLQNRQAKVIEAMNYNLYGKRLLQLMGFIWGDAFDKKRLSSWIADSSDPMEVMLMILMAKHYKVIQSEEELTEMSNVASILRYAKDYDIKLLRLELSDDIATYYGDREELEKLYGFGPVLPKYVVKAEWDKVLDELLDMHTDKSNSSNKGTVDKRIAYVVDTRNWNIEPKLQTRRGTGDWTAGRPVSLEKFRAGITDGMTQRDIATAMEVEAYEYGWYAKQSYILAGSKALATLAGNPLVYDQFGNQLEVTIEQPQLYITEKNGQYKIKSNVDLSEVDNGHYAYMDGRLHLCVVKMDSMIKETIAKLSKISFPLSTKDKITQLLSMMSNKLVVMSDVIDASNAEAVDSHPETVVQFTPTGDMIVCSVYVRPFGEVPPLFRPGNGTESVATTIEGKRVKTHRDLKKEDECCKKVMRQLRQYEYDNSNMTWTLEPEQCLNVLDSLRTLEDVCKLEWPKGERYKVQYGSITPQSFHLSLHGVTNWFELSGEVRLSEDKCMEMAVLMQLMQDTKGGFISIGENEYVRITDSLRKQIDLLRRISEQTENGMRLSSFSAMQIKNLEEIGVKVDADKKSRTLLNRISSASEKEVKIPANLNAELREYQKEGFRWMSRLAGWGAGALLADDMGLGKTVQTIAILLSRASEDAQLVVVPTSLIINWKNEISRFAPSLNVKVLNTLGTDRTTMIKEAVAYDIVITTYGLLINEEKELKARKWATIVLDEAHTIKNRDTKMSQAAMKLKGDFRLLLTGTPLQNHVSEAWNLMQFANPNLLGSFKNFTERFMIPIERDQDTNSQHALKRLMTPFMLRRTKSDVLDELPQKTEITVKVDMSEDEWGFYETLRRSALLKIGEGGSSAIQALAEITRLRQAACNAKLVEPEMKITSSKLERFMQLVDDLNANGHRALVFSQFTSHLALVRERLDKEKIEYLYLDGGTPAAERLRLVEKFQHGEMPLFLISLKAGGLGLNLTAADYVIHLDPWWNPAIEDQASDRAHRIGQQRPVTVYRLISAGTIEDKIIDLHATKRNLADALLEGGDMSAHLSKEEIMALINMQ